MFDLQGDASAVLVLAAPTFLSGSAASMLHACPLSILLGNLEKQLNFVSHCSMYLCRLNLDETALLHLSKGNWPCLKKLDMCNNIRPLSSTAISHLSDAKWPLLEWLCLTNNGFSKASVVRELSKADWPLLKTLQASNILHAAATSCIAYNTFL